LIRSILVFIIIFLASTVKAEELDCVEVKGEFNVWNGWPPALRLHDTQNNIYYGIPDDVEVSKEIIERIKKSEPVKGMFCLEDLNEETHVPYQDSPIKLVKIKRYVLY